ncbi:hypothetical protein [Botrimarina mediterranea]|nr:hypothetical protein [Botrimarina mediterranea]
MLRLFVVSNVPSAWRSSRLRMSLRLASSAWYVYRMNDCYLVVVSVEGVELIAPEHHHTSLFLLRRCFSMRAGNEACYWALLPCEKAEAIRWLISHQERRTALWLLTESTLDSGAILPDYDQFRVDEPTFSCF